MTFPDVELTATLGGWNQLSSGRITAALLAAVIVPTALAVCAILLPRALQTGMGIGRGLGLPLGGRRHGTYFPKADEFGAATVSDTVENVTHEILKSIQASISDVRASVSELRGEMRSGFDHLGSMIAKERRNSAGTLVMMRATAGDFDTRVKEIEARVDALESRI